MFENPRRGRQARNFKTNVPKILDLKSPSEERFSENCRWVPLNFVTQQSYIKNSILAKTQMVYIQKVGISHFVNYFIRLIYFDYFSGPPALEI